MADLLSADTLTGAGLALAAAGVIAGIRWLVAGKAKQLDGLPAQIHQVQMDLVKIGARLDRAEADIANDKAGRRAFAAVETDVAVIRTTLSAIQVEQRDMWSQINKGRTAA
jgi:hypothetical protein